MSDTCPKCGSELQRTKRKPVDKIINIFVTILGAVTDAENERGIMLQFT